MSRRIPLGALAFLAGLAAGGAALWWMFHIEEPVETGAIENRAPPAPDREEFDPAVKPAPPPTDYIGSQNCRECHRDIWEKYQTHPMSHSLFSAGATSPSEDFERNTTFTAGRRNYRIERTDGSVRHHEIAVDADGETIYDQAIEVQYAVGSGKRGRSYFIDRGGLLFMSPISWYSGQGQGKWDLSPSYAAAGHLRFERRIGDACVSCHAGLVNPQPGGHDRFGSPPFAELSIGCERCHGPGRKHAELRR
ncbi:MAG: multiheme c-type cytochrome, partial [Deltaproteobacteria bacterium]